MYALAVGNEMSQPAKVVFNLVPAKISFNLLTNILRAFLTSLNIVCLGLYPIPYFSMSLSLDQAPVVQ